jgi:glycosyltransferase involved in cell wall biosynthesis
MRVAVVAEFYPRRDDPTLGIWAHRQALAARDAGADVHVLVLYRPVPPRAAFTARGVREKLRQPGRAQLDGLTVDYVPFVSPPRPRSYGAWGAYAALPLAIALRRLRARFPFDLVHAHNAVPAGDAVRRLRARFPFDLVHAHNAVPAGDAVRRTGLRGVPLVVSVHGGDVYYTAPRFQAGRRNVERTFAATDLVLANSAGIEQRARALGAHATRVVHLGTDLPEPSRERRPQPTLVTVANLDPRKRHADVIRALWLLRDTHPTLRYLVIGDGPERERIAALARELGLEDRVDLAGRLDHAEALARARTCSLFVMPSVDEAFGVAYVEAMAGGLPAIGALGEPGPEEIVRSGDGMHLVAPADVEALAKEIDALLVDAYELRRLGDRARDTVERAFTWEGCGAATVAAYRDVLR